MLQNIVSRTHNRTDFDCPLQSLSVDFFRPNERVRVTGVEQRGKRTEKEGKKMRNQGKKADEGENEWQENEGKNHGTKNMGLFAHR